MYSDLLEGASAASVILGHESLNEVTDNTDNEENDTKNRIKPNMSEYVGYMVIAAILGIRRERLLFSSGVIFSKQG